MKIRPVLCGLRALCTCRIYEAVDPDSFSEEEYMDFPSEDEGDYELVTSFDTEDFIRKAKQIHGDKYDYSDTIYVKSTEKVEIICTKFIKTRNFQRNLHEYTDKTAQTACFIRKTPVFSNKKPTNS